MRAPPVSYADPTEPHTFPMPCPISFPFGDLEGVAAAPSTLSTPDSDAGLGLFGIRPKKSSYAKLKHPRHLFARKGDYICSYHGPIRSVAECVSQPSMYLFSDPTDPLHRYIDSWDPTLELQATEDSSMKASRMNRSTAPSNGLQAIPQQASMPNETSFFTKNY